MRALRPAGPRRPFCAPPPPSPFPRTPRSPFYPRRAGTVAQFASRPASLLQQWDKGGDYKWCLEGMGCCDQKGVCNQQARLVTLQAAERLAAMAECGQLNRASWEDEAALPEPEETPAGV